MSTTHAAHPEQLATTLSWLAQWGVVINSQDPTEVAEELDELAEIFCEDKHHRRIAMLYAYGWNIEDGGSRLSKGDLRVTVIAA